MNDCIFCKIGKQEVSAKFAWKGKHCFVIQDIAPKAKTHLLIIPFAHVVDMADPNLESMNHGLAQEMFDSCRELKQKLDGQQSFKIKINNGPTAGQEVLHLHWHFLSDNQLVNL